MRKRATTLLLAFALIPGVGAYAREPLENEPPSFPPPSAPTPDPVAFVVPAGVYYVTDTYVADVVATRDATTTYSTTTIHESTGTYARVIDTVDTGASSTFDGRAFNGRGELTDGRSLAGTYYENFVLTANGYVPVSIVFFQDDSETRGRDSSSSPPPATAKPATTSVPVVAATALPRGAGPAPSSRPRTPTPPAAPALRAGVALAPDGPILVSAEVLRGRLVHFWPRAFANDAPVSIRGWRLLSARPDYVSADTGTTEPFAAQWIRMPAPDVRWSLRFEIFTNVAPTERLEAQITVTVRSPALID
ncbi:MAG TPA: hypothetical protein VGR85_00135 [Candidatus Limnocylindria bacterium]|jgi:hypothetical protein|nr:hypothetical protein [Candidatus Limnocylindria bacterium]